MGSCTFRLWRTTNFRGIQKNTSYKIICVLFPIDDLRQIIEKNKKNTNKEKIDRQLARQSSSTPFMSIKDSYNRTVTFDTKID